MTTPEQEKLSGVPKEVEVIPETPEIPEYIEKGGVRPTLTQVPAQVQDDSGGASQASDDAVVLPKTEEELAELSKGSSDDAKTWWAMQIIRMIKKAIHFGKKVVGLKTSGKQ